MTISTTMVAGTSHLMVVCMVVRSRPDVSLVVGREAIGALSQLAERGDDAFFVQKGLTGVQGFQTALSCLAAVVLDDLWKPVVGDHPSARVWYRHQPASVLSQRVRRKLEAACWVRW